MDARLHNIDELFKKAIEQHSDLPSDKVWEHLEHNLQRKNVTSITRKYKRWKWVAAALFIFSAGLAMYTLYLTWRFKKVAKENKVNSSAGIVFPKGSKTYDSTTTLTNEKEKPAKEIKKKSVLPLKQVEAEEKNTDRNKAQQEKQVGKVTSIQANGQNNTNQGDKNAKTIVNKGTTEANTINPTKKREKAGSNNISLGPNSFAEDNKINNSSAKPSTQPSTNRVNEKLIAIKESVVKEYAVNELFKSTHTMPAKEEIDLTINNVKPSASVHKISPGLLAPVPGVIGKTSSRNSKSNVQNISATVHRGSYIAGAFYSNDHITTTIQPNNVDFREDRYEQIKNREKNRVATTFGISIVRNIGSNLGIESGVSSTTLTTDISAKALVARKDNTGKINYRISTSAGYAYYSVKNRPTPALADSIPTLHSTSTLKYVSVPLGVQYHLYWKRLSFTPAAIISANFLTSANITTVQSVERTFTGKIEGPKARYFDGILRLGAGYYLTKRVGINLTSSRRFAFSDPTQGKPVVTKRKVAGAALGLNYNF